MKADFGTAAVCNPEIGYPKLVKELQPPLQPHPGNLVIIGVFGGLVTGLILGLSTGDGGTTVMVAVMGSVIGFMLGEIWMQRSEPTMLAAYETAVKEWETLYVCLRCHERFHIDD